MERLTKQQILEGRKGTSEVEMPCLGSTVEIRPLTDGQWAVVEQAMSKGVTMIVRKRETQMDAEKVQTNEHSANLLVCHMGLTEEWTDQELELLPAGSVGQISEVIQEYSGVSMKKDKDKEIALAARGFCDES